MKEIRLIDANAFSEQYGDYYAEEGPEEGFIGTVGDLIDKQPTIDTVPVRHGWWIEKEHYRVHGEEYCDCECSICCHRISRVRGYYPNYCEECGSMNGGAENAGKTD